MNLIGGLKLLWQSFRMFGKSDEAILRELGYTEEDLKRREENRKAIFSSSAKYNLYRSGDIREE